MDELSEDDKLVVYRARKIQRFLSQPFFVAEVFTGQDGKFVAIKDNVTSFKSILEGKYDHLPEPAFYMVGDIQEVEAKAKSFAKTTQTLKDEAKSGKRSKNAKDFKALLAKTNLLTEKLHKKRMKNVERAALRVQARLDKYLGLAAAAKTDREKTQYNPNIEFLKKRLEFLKKTTADRQAFHEKHRKIQDEDFKVLETRMNKRVEQRAQFDAARAAKANAKAEKDAKQAAAHAM